ncbi:MAG: bacterial transcriptional activator domain-containing protein [Anaerolineae bacterium]|nr:bacterial transcriptional activator domain-containing protein [Anaerolineae bacterium]
MNFQQKLSELISPDPSIHLQIETLSRFRVWRDGIEIKSSAWTREKALHLFQFLITLRRQSPQLHKEQIIDGLWPEDDLEASERNFRVALHALNKVLEPERKSRSDPQFIQRQGLTYGLAQDSIRIDADVFEGLITLGTQALSATDTTAAITAFQQAVQAYRGDFLPESQYHDWCSIERERLQVLALNTMTTLATLQLSRNPLESIHLTQRVLAIDPIWEDAYRIQMQAYQTQGNRPLAVRTYQKCVETLARELELDPLPETQAMYESIIA